MKNFYQLSLLLSIFLSFASLTKLSAVSYTWNGSVSQEWSLNANWTPSTGIPGPLDDIIINGAGGANQPLFEELPGVRNITVSGGILDLDGFFLTATGICVFSGGQVRNGTMTLTGTSVTFSGCLVNVSVGYIGNLIRFNGSVFNNPVTVNKTGGTNDQSNGGNTFNSTFSFTNSSNRNMRMAGVSPDNHQGIVTLTNSNSGGIFMSHIASGNIYNNNIVVNSSSAIGVRFGNGGGSSTLASGRTISVGTNFTNGDLALRRFTQLGAGSLTLTGTAAGRVVFETGSVFNAKVLANFPFIFLNGSTFNDTCRVRKTGAGNITNTGGNTFNSVTYISTEGNGTYDMASTTADIFNNDLYIDDNNGSGGIGFARVALGNQFNGNIYVNCNSAGGVFWGQGGGTSTLAANKVIALWNDGFTQGSLLIRGLTQAGITTPISISQTTGSGTISFETGNVFSAPVDITFPNISLNGTTFNNTANFDKRSATTITSNGGNRFESTATFILTGNGTWGLQNVNPDIFNSTLTIDNNSITAAMEFTRTSIGNQINGELRINNISSGGISFGSNAGTTTLSTGNAISLFNEGVTVGIISFRNFTQVGAGTISLTQTTGTAALAFGPNSIWDANLAYTFPGSTFHTSTFNGDVSVTKSSGGAFNSNGGNTFQGAFTFTNTTAGQIILGNVTADIFNGPITVNNSGTCPFFFANTNVGHQFNNSITLNSTGTSQGIRFGQNGGRSTLASGFIITTPSITSGNMIFRGLTKVGTEAMTFTASGPTTLFQFETNMNVSGDLTITTPSILFNGSTFNGNVTVTKTLASTNHSNGGNTFNGNFSYSSAASGTVTMANLSADVFNGNITLDNNSATGAINMTQNGAGNQINGSITVSCASTGGINFGAGGGLTAMPNGTISLGAGGFTAGTLGLRGFTKTSATAINLSQIAGTATISFLQGADITGVTTLTFPNLNLDRVRFRNDLTMTKNGTGINNNNGGCTFDGAVSITNTTTGQFCFGNALVDVFNGNLTLNNSGNALMLAANGGGGHQFNGNIILNSTGASQGIRFGQGNGTATLADGRTITIGGSGHTIGSLRLRNIVQAGTTTPQSLTLTGTSTIYLETGNRFESNFTLVAPQIFLNGTRFNGVTSISQNGTAGVTSNGGNSFFGATTLNLSSSGSWILGNVSPDLFQSTLAINSSGSGLFSLANTGTLHNFASNVVVTSTGTSQGIRFGQNGGTSTLVSGGAISIGAGGFTSGTLRIRGLTQNGTGTPQSLTFATANTGLYLEANTIFNSSVSASANLLFLNGTRFNNDAVLTQTGSTITSSTGSNIFNGTTLVRATGTGEFRLATVSNDTYGGNVTFNQTTALTLFPAYTFNALLNGNVSTTGTTQPINFSPAAGTPRVIFGGTNQQLSGSAALAPVIRNLTLNLTSGTLTLNVPLTITVNATFTNGILTNNTTNLLILNDNATLTTVSNASHVNGAVRKIGNDAFTFPLGNGTIYRPIGMAAPAVATDHFTAQYINGNSDGTYSHNSKDVSINNISICEYWILDRTNGASAVTVNLSWAANSCGVGNPATLQVCRWNGTTWRDHGNGGTFSAGGINFLSTSGSVSSFSPFTLGSQNNENPLPIELLYFGAKQTDKKVVLDWATASETNNHFFQIERSKDAINYEIVGMVSGAGNSTQQKNYSFTDNDPLTGVSYYKMIQTDFDGETEEFGPEMVEFLPGSIEPEIYPNPFTDKLTLTLNGLQIKANDLQIVDLSGRIVQGWNIVSHENGNSEINTKDLPTGIYMLKIKTGNTFTTKRIVRH